MKHFFVAIFVVFVFTGGFSAQITTTDTSQVVPSDLASREDLRKATAEMKKSVRDAEKKSAEQIAKARADAERQAVKAREDAERQHKEVLRQSAEAEERLRAQVAEAAAKQQKAEEEAQARWKEEVKFWGMGGVGMIVFSLIALGVFLARGRTKAPEVRVDPTSLESDEDLLKDPEIKDLKEFAVRNGNISKVMFRLSLPSRGTSLDGEQMICTAKLRGDLPPLVYFEGDPGPVAWDKRRKRAALIAASRKSAVAGSATQ